MFNNCEVSYHDPFEEYKQRLARKLAHRAEAEKSGGGVDAVKKKESGTNDDVNWFGTRIGGGDAAFGGKGSTGGVGRYLNVSGKRLRDEGTPAASGGGGDVGQETKKKKKLGFGDFEGW